MLEQRDLLGAALAAVALMLSSCVGAPQDAERAADFWSCPDGYQVKEGLNTNFPSGGMMRALSSCRRRA